MHGRVDAVRVDGLYQLLSRGRVHVIVSAKMRQKLVSVLPFAICFLIGCGFAIAAGYTIVQLHSASWFQTLLVLVLFLCSCVAFALGSARLDGWLVQHSRVGGGIHWFAISAIALVAVSLLAVPQVLAGPKDAVSVLAENVGVAVAAGVLVAALQPVVAWLIHLSLEHVWPDRAADWEPPENGWRRFWALLVRCVVVAVLGLAFSVAFQAAVADGGAQDGNKKGIYVPVATWAVGSAIAWWATSRLFPDPAHHVSRHTVYGGAVGLVCFVVAASLFAHYAEGSLMNSAWSTDGVRDLGRATAIPLVSSWTQNDRTLARAFEPELRFQPREHWFPTSIGWFLKNKQLIRSSSCKNGCYALSACDDARGACAPDGSTDPTVYVRVEHGGKGWFAGDTREPSILARGWVLLQYWFFYNYDSLEMPVVSQWHQSDWEQVSVALAIRRGAATPVEVAFSEHCIGTVLPWSLVEIGRGSTHPLVFVAQGSHANYPRPIDAPVRQLICSLGIKPPRYLGVGDLFFESSLRGAAAEVPVDYILGIRDETGETAPPTAYRLQPFSRTDAVETFHGEWGLDDNLTLFGIGLSGGPAARSPSDQPPWKHPGQSMLCNSNWFSPDETPACKDVSQAATASSRRAAVRPAPHA
jgi:hypothetical protein